jgi:glycosyltransferase involved in cell wall biosynthesis
MIVIHLSSASFDSGAGIAVLTLHKAMLSKGIDSRLYSSDDVCNTKSVFSYTNINTKIKSKYYYWFDRLLIKLLGYRGSSAFSMLRRGRTWPSYNELKDADIVHLHWVGNSFLNLQDLEVLKAKFVWTLRDWWPLTGGWHMPHKGDQFFTNGSPSALSPKRFLFNLAAKEQFKKTSFLKNTSKVAIVAQSNFMKKDVEKALGILPEKVSVIPSIINDSVYKYVDKKSARERLNLPLEASYVAIGATSVNDAYKGMHILRDIPGKTKLSECVFLVFGSGKIDLPSNIERREYGFISSEAMMRDIYAASDIFLCPSLHEPFGKVAVEAIACGTPIVAFAGTGPAEIIERTGGGRIARPNDTESFFNEAEEQLGEINERFRSTIALLAHKEYSSENIVLDHFKLYSDFLNEK